MCCAACMLSLMTYHNSLMEAQMYEMENSFFFPHYIYVAKCVCLFYSSVPKQ
jgi:hypothetical protein